MGARGKRSDIGGKVRRQLADLDARQSRLHLHHPVPLLRGAVFFPMDNTSGIFVKVCRCVQRIATLKPKTSRLPDEAAHVAE